jgi:hypothetical protein
MVFFVYLLSHPPPTPLSLTLKGDLVEGSYNERKKIKIIFCLYYNILLQSLVRDKILIFVMLFIHFQELFFSKCKKINLD